MAGQRGDRGHAAEYRRGRHPRAEPGVPSLLVSSTTSEAGAGVARIRGIGTVGDNPGLESSVAVFIDGVYRSRTGVGLTELGPVDRIEVLRGPQGTLFGRNASAGLILVITAKPRFTPRSLWRGDDRQLRHAPHRAWRQRPVQRHVAARIDGIWMKRDGFLKDVISGGEVNDRDRWMLRGQLLYQPSDDLSVRLIADYAKRNEECCAAVYLPTRTMQRTRSDSLGAAAVERHRRRSSARLGGVILDDPYRSRRRDHARPQLSARTSRMAAFRARSLGFRRRRTDLDHRLSIQRIRRRPGRRFQQSRHPLPRRQRRLVNRFKTFTQELRLQGELFDDRLDWLVGGYYADEKLKVATICPTARIIALRELHRRQQLRRQLHRSGNPGASGSAMHSSTRASDLLQPAVAASLAPFSPAASATAFAAFARLGAFAGAGRSPTAASPTSASPGRRPVTFNGVGIDD